MISLIIGLLFGVLMIAMSFSPDITSGGIRLAVTMAGLSIMLKSLIIFQLGGGV